jgi:hypothetical protein
MRMIGENIIYLPTSQTIKEFEEWAKVFKGF